MKLRAVAAVFASATIVALGFAAGAGAQAGAEQPSPTQQRIAMLRQSLQASQQQIRAYEWVETTVVSYGGEEKSRKQQRCFYGANGVLAKVLLSESAPASGGPPGVLPIGRIAKRAAGRKKEELTAYMQSAVELVHAYVPPDPGRIQQSGRAGKASVNMVEPGRRVRLDFGDYLKPGDRLSAGIDTRTNQLLSVSVASYLETPDDPIQLEVTMAVLPDGTAYAARTTLDAPAEKLAVTVENTGYRRAGG